MLKDFVKYATECQTTNRNIIHRSYNYIQKTNLEQLEIENTHKDIYVEFIKSNKVMHNDELAQLNVIPHLIANNKLSKYYLWIDENYTDDVSYAITNSLLTMFKAIRDVDKYLTEIDRANAILADAYVEDAHVVTYSLDAIETYMYTKLHSELPKTITELEDKIDYFNLCIINLNNWNKSSIHTLARFYNVAITQSKKGYNNMLFMNRLLKTVSDINSVTEIMLLNKEEVEYLNNDFVKSKLTMEKWKEYFKLS